MGVPNFTVDDVELTVGTVDSTLNSYARRSTLLESQVTSPPKAMNKNEINFLSWKNKIIYFLWYSNLNNFIYYCIIH